MIWATGFTGEFGYLPGAVVDAQGLPVHAKGSTPDPGIFVLGFPWLTRRRSGIISGVDDDAAMITERIGARLAGG